MKSLDYLKGYFRSGNHIPVERATIKATEFDALVAEVEALESKLREYLSYDSCDGRKQRMPLRAELKKMLEGSNESTTGVVEKVCGNTQP